MSPTRKIQPAERAVRILGLDPGSRFTGYGVIERRGRRLVAVAQGRIALPARDPLADRLVILCRELRGLVRRHQPDAAVLESLFRGVNNRSLIVLAQARGALLATLAEEGLAISEYSPAEIKSAVAGHGRADKEQVGTMVRLILGLQDVRLAADASDALAAAICCAERWRWDRLETGASASVDR